MGPFRYLSEGGSGAGPHFARGKAPAKETLQIQDHTHILSLSWTKRGKIRNCLHPFYSPFPYFNGFYERCLQYRWKMTPFDRSSTLTQCERLSIRPRRCPQCSEFEGGCSAQGHTTEGDGTNLKEVYKAGDLTVLAGDRELPDGPVQLDFHFKLGIPGATHWHGLLQGQMLFLDAPHQALERCSRDSLTATLEYVEEETDVDRVFVNFRKCRSDRGNLLRAFSYLGFELVRPGHPALPPWRDVVFMVYPLERETGPKAAQESPKLGAPNGEEGSALAESASGPI
ncbi:LOW QUALITY PROTEIN: ornithine decarboxylase antizyme 3 [Sphaerodactylus townsendi]|uniref:LOW QUALITY PROTEIN: ornithine decarboxylase antizyme 3 n=1 Tax=Sphaerodactylus townsendi TaxID=933632 RepID=UPI0020276785|nr:LOW QUALITY PROTEIN: ornithine decarboxylase antizyme 3 [Sphaerodactylus townsendi]